MHQVSAQQLNYPTHRHALLNGIPVAFGASSDVLVARKASSVLAVVKAPKQGFQHLQEGAGKGASMLARSAMPGVVTLRIDHDAHLGVAIERDAPGISK